MWSGCQSGLMECGQGLKIAPCCGVVVDSRVPKLLSHCGKLLPSHLLFGDEGALRETQHLCTRRRDPIQLE